MVFDEDDDEFDRDEPTNPDYRESRARVLVVEDDESLRQLIVMRMRREGYDVVEAGSGDEALDVLTLAARSPQTFATLDLLVMDVHMPGTSGLEIARMARAAAWTIPVLLITAFPDRDVVLEAGRLGVELLAKPFALDRLSEVATAALLSGRTPVHLPA